jgi:hypothetical protein
LLAILPYFPPVAGDGSFLGRLAKSPDEVRADNLKAWATSIGGAVPIKEVVTRTKCRVAGVIMNIRIDPREGRDAIEATISDGTGRMVARWIGRSSLEGIRLGAGLIIEGTAGVGEHNECVLLNPEYRLVTDPEHG